MGVKDWFRQLVPFHRRNLLDDREREQAVRDAIEKCREKRVKADDPPDLAETDAVFDDLIDAYEKFGLDPCEVWVAADIEFPDNPRWLEALAARALGAKTTDRDTLQILRRQSERDPENLPLLLRLIDCYREAGDEYMQAHTSAAAHALAQRLAHAPPGRLPAGFTPELCHALLGNLEQDLARIYLALGREDEEALGFYLKAIERDVSQTDFLAVVSRKFLAQGRTDPEAITLHEEALAFDPANLELQRFLGCHYLQTERFHEGLGILRILATATPPDPQALETLVAYLPEHRDQWEPSDVALLLSHFQSHRDNAVLLESLTTRFLGKKDTSQEAIGIYRQALASGVETAACRDLLARYHAERREWPLVVEILEQALQQDRNLAPDLLLVLANAYADLGRTDEAALSVYHAAVQAGSNAQPIHEALCRHFYVHKRDTPEAHRQFRQTLELFPECRWAALGLIHEHFTAQRYTLAFEDSLALYKRGGDTREILALMARALAHEPNPRFLAALNALGEKTAREILRLAYNEKPSAKRIALALARAEVRTGTRDMRLIPILRTALSFEPDDIEIATVLSESLWRSGREDEGAEVDNQTLEWLPSSRLMARAESGTLPDDRLIAARQAAVRLSGYYARKAMTTPEALAALRKALDMDVCADEAVVFLARHLADKDNHSRKDLQVLERALSLQPQDVLLRMAMLRAKALRGEVEQPLRWCLEQLKASPGRQTVRALLREVVDNSRKQDFTSAVLGQLRGLCSANPDDQELVEIAARAHQTANITNPQVRAIFEKAMGGQFEDPDLMRNLAHSYLDSGDNARAARLFTTLHQKTPDDPEVLVTLARLHARLHHLSPEAAEVLEKARALHPQDRDLAFFHCELLMDRGQIEQAVRILEPLLLEKTVNSDSLLTIADRFRGLLEDTPRGLLLLAQLYIQAGEPDDALHMLDTLQLTGEIEETDILPIYNTLVETDPENVRARMERAVLHKVAGRYDEALADFEALAGEEGPTQSILAEQAEVLQLKLANDPDPDLESLRKLARLHQSAGEARETLAVYGRILEREPTDQEARRAMARAALDLEKLDEAAEHLRQCRSHPEIATCLSDLARAYERKSLWAKAAEALRNTVATGNATQDDETRLGRLELRLRQDKAAQSARNLIRELPDSTQERYELLQQIAVNEGEALYRAYDRTLDEVVSLKIFAEGFPPDEKSRAFFLRRADAVKALNHPQIVRIHDIGRQPPRLHLAMEYLTGGDLAAKIRRVRGPLSIPEVRRLAGELASALQTAHANELIHGALAPNRILYNIDGKIKITGFAPGPSSPWYTALGVLPPLAVSQTDDPFRSPQLRDGNPPIPADDIFSFGALLYQVVSGRSPDPQKPLDTEQTANEMATAIRRAGPGLSSVILQCLSPQPQDRLDNFERVIQALGHKT